MNWRKNEISISNVTREYGPSEFSGSFTVLPPLKEDIRCFIEDENAIGVIEIVLILVVLIGLVAIFKTQINSLLTRIFTSINSLSDDIL